MFLCMEVKWDKLEHSALSGTGKISARLWCEQNAILFPVVTSESRERMETPLTFSGMAVQNKEGEKLKEK